MNKKPYLILICGPSGCGKTTLANFIKERLSSDLKCAIVSQDNFYQTKDKIPQINGVSNFDHPHSFDWEKIEKFIDNVLNHQTGLINLYDFKSSSYSKEVEIIDNDIDVLIFEGIYSLYDKNINAKADLKLYIDTEMDECFIRRLERDIENRGRSAQSIIKQWREVVKPMYSQFIWNLRIYADLIIPSPSDYSETLSLLDLGIKGKFKKDGNK